MGFLLPLVELRCVFKNAAKYEDEVTVVTTVEEMTNLRITFHYEVFKDNQSVLLASGETLHVWTDKNLKPVNIKKHSIDIYNTICEASGKSPIV